MVWQSMHALSIRRYGDDTDAGGRLTMAILTSAFSRSGQFEFDENPAAWAQIGKTAYPSLPT